MADEMRRLTAAQACQFILSQMHGEMPHLAALLADYDALQRENDALRHENGELRRQVEELRKAVSLSSGDLPGEEWRDVVGYEGLYQVSNCGRVRSLHKDVPKILSLLGSDWGYLNVSLSKYGEQRKLAVHRLVAEAFIPNPEGKEQVNHIDGNKQNNRVENLEWVTRSENSFHAYRTGLSKGPRQKLTDEQALYVRENPDGLTGLELAEMFGVKPSLVSKCRTGKTYKYVK